ncbi:hypothetical protein PS639_06503 [Pseudomonas fluorescens]|nr:hypothetical protein PS639_06475 [Pseudomonas fluorescens]VVN49558.1 hypothetical protein PS639_06503 [Pseudomonas fluorescens]
MQKPYDPLPAPPSCVWHPAPTAIPLGSLGDDQPVVAHPQPRPQPSGVLRPAKPFTDRPRRGRCRVQQGRPAPPGTAGIGGQFGGTRRVFLPDASARLAWTSGQTRGATDPDPPGQRPEPERGRRRANHSGQRVLGSVAGQRIEPVETAVRRQLGGYRAPAPVAQHHCAGPQDPRAVFGADPPARADRSQQGPRAHRAHGPADSAGAFPQPQSRGDRPGHLPPAQPGQGPAQSTTGQASDPR